MNDLISSIVALIIQYHRQGNVQGVEELCAMSYRYLESEYILDFYEEYFEPMFPNLSNEDVEFIEKEKQVLSSIVEKHINDRRINVKIDNITFIGDKNKIRKVPNRAEIELKLDKIKELESKIQIIKKSLNIKRFFTDREFKNGINKDKYIVSSEENEVGGIWNTEYIDIKEVD
jgi:hypothetical protein